MPLELAEILVALIKLYALAGGLVGGLFVTLGIARVDPAAAGAPLGLRLLLWPLSAALWPWTLWRWWRGAPRTGEATAHKRALAAGRPR